LAREVGVTQIFARFVNYIISVCSPQRRFALRFEQIRKVTLEKTIKPRQRFRVHSGSRRGRLCFHKLAFAIACYPNTTFHVEANTTAPWYYPPRNPSFPFNCSVGCKRISHVERCNVILEISRYGIYSYILDTNMFDITITEFRE